MRITGFDWDSGNWPKCGKHGVSREEIEQVLLGATSFWPSCFGTFFAGQTKIRPISARYMHQKEISHYEDHQI